MNLDWINDFLPTMRCPDTHQSLRWATAEDLLRHAMPPETQSLARDDGSRLFPIDHGIPILLPEP
jgi:uncharacterized protein YbaR (Trm112 family)